MQFTVDILIPLKHNITMNASHLNSACRSSTCLIEGCSIRSTVRMTGVAKKTVMRLVLEVGEFCAEYQDQSIPKPEMPPNSS